MKKIAVYLGCNGAAGTPTAYASSFYVCANYDDSVELDKNDDYAIIRFSSNITDCWFGINAEDNPVEIPYTMNVAGYPAKHCIPSPVKPQVKTFEMWYSTGKVVGHDTYFLEHNIGTDKGESGAPVYYYDPVRRQWMVCAINIGSSENKILGNQNWGRRMTKELYDWLDGRGYI